MVATNAMDVGIENGIRIVHLSDFLVSELCQEQNTVESSYESVICMCYRWRFFTCSKFRFSISFILLTTLPVISRIYS